MLSRRYTIVIADRSSGVVRSFTLSLRPALAALLAVFTLPLLIGLGARWSASAEIQQLRTASANLDVENRSYRAATAELTTQITALQTAIADLSDRSTLDPDVSGAITRLPAVVRSRAMGGASPAPGAIDWLSSSLPSSPESTFGVLRDLLEALEGRLQFVRTGVERRQALAAATPSIWPAQGWLSGSFGRRRDPFTGGAAFHPALDISSDSGQPIYATADGTVLSASYNGAYGNLVELAHGFGLTTRYGHMSRYAVRAGDMVKRGEVIGYVGSTGRATGAHLHYEVWVNGKPINPLQLLLPKDGR